MMRIDYEIPLNNIEIWKLVNETMVAHPFHIHDVQFYLFDRSGTTPPAEELGRKDVVLVPPGDSVMFITKFEDFADTIIPFMYHCHILMHEDDGMMGQFIVKPNLTSVSEIALNDLSIKIYPNPAKEILFLNIEQLSDPKPVEVKVYNSIGKLIYQTDTKDTNTVIDIGQWASGLYVIEIQQEGSRAFKKIIVE